MLIQFKKMWFKEKLRIETRKGKLCFISNSTGELRFFQPCFGQILEFCIQYVERHNYS
jgi:hypothetical protein